MKAESRANVASSFTVIKGSMINETYAVLAAWDFGRSKRENLDHLRETNFIGATSIAWLRDVCWVLNRRFEPDGVDRPLVTLAQKQFPIEEWKPLLLWHMTRSEFLVRDFLENWLFNEFEAGSYRSSRLLTLRAMLPARTPVEVKWTKNDVGHIWVWDSIQKEYFKVDNAAPDFKGLTLEQARAVKKSIAQSEPDQQVQRADAAQTIRDLVAEAVSDKKLKVRKGGTRMANTTSRAGREGLQAPVGVEDQPTDSPDQGCAATEVDDTGLEFEFEVLGARGA